MVSVCDATAGIDQAHDVRKHVDGFPKGTRFGFRTHKTLRRSDRVDKRTERALV